MTLKSEPKPSIWLKAHSFATVSLPILQAIAIIFAGIFAYWKFVHQEIIVPGRLPASLSTSVTMKPTEETTDNKNLYSIEANFKINNFGKRRTCIFGNRYIVRGFHVKNNGLEQQNFESLISNIEHEQVNSKYINWYDAEVVAIGRFNEQCFDPGEEYFRSVVFHAPSKNFDFLELVLVNLTTDDENLKYVKNSPNCDLSWIPWESSIEGLQPKLSDCLENVKTFQKILPFCGFIARTC